MTPDLIAEAARTILDKQPTADRLDVMADSFRKANTGRLDEAGAYVLDFGTGETFAAWLARECVDAPALPKQPAPPPSTAAARSATKSDARDLELAGLAEKIVATGKNPWAPLTVNRTHQAIVGKFRPDDATRLRLEAMK